MFLEEPVWPPEDFATLADVRTKGGLNIAAGENACTVHQFRQMMKAGAVSHAQPSVIKVGGITEYLRVVALADELGVRLAPHSPYFGPGLLATLQLLSLRDDASFVEMFYMKRAACLWRGRIDVDANGDVEVPQGPGLGYEPDTSRDGAIPRVVTAGRRRYFAPSFAGAASFAAGAASFAAGVAAFFASSAAFCAACISTDDLLQANDRALQRLDLPVGGIDLLLMVRSSAC